MSGATSSSGPPWWHPSRYRQRNPLVLDIPFAGFLLIFGLLTLAGNAEAATYDARPTDFLAYVITVVGFGALALRRVRTVPTFAVVLAMTVAFTARDYAENGLPFACMIALYTLASLTKPRVSAVGAAATAGSILLLTAIGAQGLDPGGAAANMAFFGIAFACGHYIRIRRAYTEQLELRAAEAEENQRREAEQAVAEERLRIARELHDVVAHAMSVVAVQSGVAAHVIDGQPAEAKAMLQNINTTSRQALDEMRRLLGVLRADGESPAELAPAPTLADLGSLVASVESTGVDVQVAIEGEPVPLAPGVDLTAFRIVQEALTNVVKHAGPASVQVRVVYEPAEVDVEVVDDGRGAASVAAEHPPGSGHGLLGMRERVELYHGTLEAGPRAGGGFRVAARLPLSPDLVAS
jgi:signal transduction histidine kinase